MNELDVAVYGKLAGDVTLAGLSNGGFHQMMAPDTAVFNYTVFQRLLNIPDYVFSNSVSSEVFAYQIKHYAIDGANNTTKSGPVAAGSMMDRARVVLHNQILTVTGKTMLSSTFDRSIPDGAERSEAQDRWVYSKGGIYLFVIA